MKLKDVEWSRYRHPEFLKSLNFNFNELQYIRLFLKRGSVSIINQILRERQLKPNITNSENALTQEKIKSKITG